MRSAHIYEVQPRSEKRGVDLISDVLPFGRLWHGEPDAIGNAFGYAKFRSRSHNAVIRVHLALTSSDRKRVCGSHYAIAGTGDSDVELTDSYDFC